jgi:DNA-binding NarL/FixJ family response regulator
MKSKCTPKARIHVAVVESDPLRLVGLRALLGEESGFELVPASLAEATSQHEAGVVMIGGQPENSLLAVLDSLRATRPDLRVLLTVAEMTDQTVLTAIASGARGCVDETASQSELAHALRIVNEGGTWASRKVLAAFIEQSNASFGRVLRRAQLTSRERQVLEMLVEGRSNKEIAVPLGIEERTVKSHVAKLMRKVGVQNRILLSIHAIKHSLVSTAAAN